MEIHKYAIFLSVADYSLLRTLIKNFHVFAASYYLAYLQ